MEFTFRIWKFELSIVLLDIDPSDREVMVGFKVIW
jgi:hypothetical protein